MDLFMGVPPQEYLKLLQNLSEEEFEQKSKQQGLSKERMRLPFKILKRKVKIDYYLEVDIQRYALKYLFPETYAALSLGNHIYSTSDFYEYDPPKNGQNIIKHGISFHEVISSPNKFGTLMVQCPDNKDGTRCVIFSNMDSGINGENLDLPLSGITGVIYIITVAQQVDSKYRFISSRILSQKSYPEIMERSFKNIYEDDPAKKDGFVKHCIEIIERDLFN
ncbi:hypothetical protein B0T40_09490 [Chromobacterium haemolyticum]|nr:hypothetical protein B0T40_09490 [Chromobacterium haemolyticum]